MYRAPGIDPRHAVAVQVAELRVMEERARRQSKRGRTLPLVRREHSRPGNRLPDHCLLDIAVPPERADCNVCAVACELKVGAENLLCCAVCETPLSIAAAFAVLRHVERRVAATYEEEYAICAEEAARERRVAKRPALSSVGSALRRLLAHGRLTRMQLGIKYLATELGVAEEINATLSLRSWLAAHWADSRLCRSMGARIRWCGAGKCRAPSRGRYISCSKRAVWAIPATRAVCRVSGSPRPGICGARRLEIVGCYAHCGGLLSPPRSS